MRIACCAAVAFGLSACGGEIGGTVTGLGTGRSVTLLNNGTDSLTVTSNGPFAFIDFLDAESAYVVTVMTQPVGQLCNVADGSGTTNAQADSVDTVRVTCADLASLAGTVSGLSLGTAVILGNGSVRLQLTSSGPFAFPGTISTGTAYDVIVITQPLGATCTVANGAGIFDENVATNVEVTCG